MDVVIFLVLPTHKDVPDYYQKISKPINFRKIKVHKLCGYIPIP